MLEIHSVYVLSVQPMVSGLFQVTCAYATKSLFRRPNRLMQWLLEVLKIQDESLSSTYIPFIFI